MLFIVSSGNTGQGNTRSIYLAMALICVLLTQSGCLFIGPILALKKAQERESKQSGQKPDPSTSASQAVPVQVEE